MRIQRLRFGKTKLTSIALGLGLICTLLQTQQAFAVQCLSQFPDSAWVKGQPSEVSSLLNRDLVLAKVTAERTADGKNIRITDPSLGLGQDTFVNDYLNNTYSEYIWKSGFVPTTYSVVLNYQYEGVNCAARNIKVQGGSITYRPYFEFSAMDSVKMKESFYRLTTKSGLEIEKIVEAIANFGMYLESTENLPLKISQYKNYVKETDKLRAVLGQDRVIDTLQSDDNCVVDASPEKIDLQKRFVDKLSSVEKSFYENNFRVTENFLSTLKFTSNKSCKLKVSFVILRGSSYVPIARPVVALKGREPVRVNGYLWLTNDLPTPKNKTTINCVKGKLTKKVTGMNPKCPTGYKVQK
jgi:hypothetical protein